MTHPEDRVALLGRVVASLRDPGDPTRRALEAAAVEETGISAAMATRGWDLALARYTPDAMTELAREDRVGQTVGVVLGASVAVAPLRALALPWLAGAAVRVRPSRHHRVSTQLLVERMAAEGAAVTLWSEADWAGITAVVAYGRDETLDVLMEAVPEGVGFAGYGHGFGMALVGAEAVDDAAVAAAVARDVALYDQAGCLSPQGVVVLGDAARFGQRLRDALDALAAVLPRGVGRGGAESVQWMGVEAALGGDVTRASGGVLSVRNDGPLQGSPGGRVVLVRGVASVAEARALLAPHAAHLSCVGVSAGFVGWETAGYAGRTVALGTMQDPPLDGPEDRRGPRVRRR